MLIHLSKSFDLFIFHLMYSLQQTAPTFSLNICKQYLREFFFWSEKYSGATEVENETNDHVSKLICSFSIPKIIKSGIFPLQSTLAQILAEIFEQLLHLSDPLRTICFIFQPYREGIKILHQASDLPSPQLMDILPFTI